MRTRSFGRRGRVIAKVERQLIGVRDEPFAPPAIQPLQQLPHGQLQFFVLLRQLLTRVCQIDYRARLFLDEGLLNLQTRRELLALGGELLALGGELFALGGELLDQPMTGIPFRRQ
jgi:hypothetical protein